MFKSRRIYYTLFIVGALYALLVQQFFKNEGRFILQSPKYTNEIPYAFKEKFQELNLPINQEVNLHGIWFKHDTSKAIVLLFPTSDLDLREINIDTNAYYLNGFDVLIVAYRGTSQSSGKLQDEADLFSDAQNWYQFCKSQFTEKEIVIVGQGFGASIAAQIAGNNQPKALILENPYYSYGDYQSKTRFWWLPYNYFTSFPLNTWEDVRRATCQIILIQDEDKKDKINNLLDFLKKSDKCYWLKYSEGIPFSNQLGNRLLFNEILLPFFS